jgi:hypothetical protein
MDDKKLDRIETKIDKLDSRLDSVDVTLAKQHESLKDHIRRTELLEQEIKPVAKHVAIMNFLGKVAFVLLGSDGLWELLKWLNS